MLLDIFTLLILFQFKHFVVDYPLQTQYMLGKMKKEGWFTPLLAHVIVHGLLTAVIAFIFTQNIILILLVVLIDMSIHFTMDRIKASPNIWGKLNIQEPQFWWALGFDQMIHHFTHYMIIFMIIIELY